MSKASIQTSPHPAAPTAVTPEAPRTETARPRSRKGPVRRVLEALASLKLTVVLLALSIVLVFCGTLAQIDHGIWAVVDMYFYSLAVWVPVQLFFPRTLHVPLWLGFPFPGGLLLGILLLTNLLAAHLVRFKLSWKRSGILLIHGGLIVLMISQAVYHYCGVEGTMAIFTGESANYVMQNERMELAVVAPIDAKSEEVTSVPGSKLRKGGTIQHPALPFDVRVVRYMPNSAEPEPLKDPAANPATAGVGLKVTAVPREEGVGVDPDQKVDTPTAYLEFKKRDGGESLGVYLVSAWLGPQTVEVDGRKYEVSMRPHRDYKNYTIRLEEFKHDIYPGTNVPKNFSSQIRLLDPRYDVNREVLIKMNDPLRYQGETFYQAGVLGRDEGTQLQVVRNPGWQLPYIACTMVILGLAVHFGISLVGYLRRRALS
jgi:ResB-like family protein